MKNTRLHGGSLQLNGSAWPRMATLFTALAWHDSSAGKWPRAICENPAMSGINNKKSKWYQADIG